MWPNRKRQIGLTNEPSEASRKFPNAPQLFSAPRDPAQPSMDKITVREIVKAALVVLFVVLYVAAVMYFAFNFGGITSETKLEMQHRY